MSKKNRILVLMATYNGEKYIKKQVETIVNQKEVYVEILVSDDSSTDKTIALINHYAAACKINILNNKVRFGSAASNFFNLIEKCQIESFDYIAFADQDDIWFEDKLISATNTLEASSHDAFSSDVIAYWPKYDKKKIIKKSYTQKKYDHWFESPGPGCSQVFTMSSFRKFKEFIISNKKKLKHIDYHDWLVYAFYKYNKFKWIIADEPKILYRQHDNNVSGANYSFKDKWKRLKKIADSWYKHQIIINYELVTRKKFSQYIKDEKLILKPFDLRRDKLYSLAVWILILLRTLKN